MHVQASEKDAEDLTSSCLDLISNFATAALDMLRRWNTMKAAEAMPASVAVENVPVNAFDRMSDAAVRDYAVGLVYLISKNEHAPEIAGAASSLLLLMGKVSGPGMNRCCAAVWAWQHRSWLDQRVMYCAWCWSVVNSTDTKHHLSTFHRQITPFIHVSCTNNAI